MSDAAIAVRGLKKSYGRLEAVAGIDLDVGRGEVFALLGPNGAGKTTTVEILEGHRQRSAGDVAVLGFDPARNERAFKERIGIVLQSTSLPRYLTVAEVIDQFREYYPSPRPRDEVIELVGLREKRNERVSRLSGGQQRRLDVGIGLAGDPDLLFLDEPTTGFDPSARRNAWGMVKDLAALGKTVFLTTHYMDEAQALAGRVAIIANGRILAEGPPGSLAGTEQNESIIRFDEPQGRVRPPKRVLDGAIVKNGRIEIRTADPTRSLHALTSWAVERRVTLEGLSVSRPSLEDVYLQLTKPEGGE